MLANKHTRNVCLLSAPSDHAARGVLAQDTLTRTPLWLTMMKPYLSANGHRDPKQADRNDSGQLALSPEVLICPPPLLGHHLMVTSLLDLSEVIIWRMKDGDGKRTFKLGLIVTMSCHRWDSNAKNKTHLIPPNKTLPFLNPQFLARVHPPNHLRTLRLEPEPEVAPTQSTEKPFACLFTPYSIIIIKDTPIESPPSHPVFPLSTPTPVPSQCPQEPQLLLPPVQSPSHSHNDACQEFTNLQPTLMIP
ncbi:hypothetical protein O181_083673 [Austropuccinia psidii MF-1]|uniref:Uncharacterized protein n=1 Tax=Austropuccinia psidii MF-1 TaxID=1389203 RepID=A0A9Q3FU45_9BASI|nr:hypothetical protein [Austropuccinia psidii MF-1]